MDTFLEGPVCCLKCTKQSSFQHVIDLDNLRVTILRYKADDVEQVQSVGDDGKITNIFIIINNHNNSVNSDDIHNELDVNKVKCPRCRYRAEKVLKMLSNKICLKKGDIKGICDHCRKEQLSQNLCSVCEDIVKKFLEVAGPRQKQIVLHKEVKKPLTNDATLYLKSIMKSKTELYSPIIIPPKHTTIVTKPNDIEIPSDESVVTSFITTFSKDEKAQKEKRFRYIFPEDKPKELVSKSKIVGATSSSLLLNIQDKQKQQKLLRDQQQVQEIANLHKLKFDESALDKAGKQKSKIKQLKEKPFPLANSEPEMKVIEKQPGIPIKQGSQDEKPDKSSRKDKPNKKIETTKIESDIGGGRKLDSKSREKKVDAQRTVSGNKLQKASKKGDQGKDEQKDKNKPKGPKKSDLDKYEHKGGKAEKAKKIYQNKKEQKDGKAKIDFKKLSVKDMEKKTDAQKLTLKLKDAKSGTEKKATEITSQLTQKTKTKKAETIVGKETQERREDRHKVEPKDSKAKKDDKKIPPKDVTKRKTQDNMKAVKNIKVGEAGSATKKEKSQSKELGITKEKKQVKGDEVKPDEVKVKPAAKPEFDIMKLLPVKKEMSVFKNKGFLSEAESAKLAEKKLLELNHVLLKSAEEEYNKKGLPELPKGEYYLFKINVKGVPQSQIVRKQKLKNLINAVALKNMKMRGPSYDNLILKLVKIGEKRKKSYTKIEKKQQGKYKIRSARRTHSLTSLISIDSDLALDIESLTHFVTARDIVRYKVKNTRIVKNVPEKEKPKLQPDPILYENKHGDDIEKLVQIFDVEEEPKVETESLRKGIISYTLSDLAFIEKGWTVLPRLKVLRKMNIYKVRPAHPEFDWFSHNKSKGVLKYGTGEKLAQFDDNGCGRWYYKNGIIALDYYDSEDLHAQQRFVVYSSGEKDERCRSMPVTVLAIFDYLGNGVVFDHSGKIRIKYNQSEGVVLDSGIGPETRWKWHTLNDPPELKQVMIDTYVDHPYPEIIELGDPTKKQKRQEDEAMLAIEYNNFAKQKTQKVKCEFKPYQITMKSLKINKQFSLKILDQAHVYLYFRDGLTTMKLNLGMVLDHQEIIDTETVDVSAVNTCIEQFPPKTESILDLQTKLKKIRQCERERMAYERKIRPIVPVSSADKLIRSLSKPLRHPPVIAYSHDDEIGNCHRKPSKTNLYYDTRLI